MKKSWLASFCLSFAICANAQSKADSLAATDAMLANRRLEQQAMAQQMAAERQANSQQAEQQYEIALAEQVQQNQEAQLQIQDKIASLKKDIESVKNDIILKQSEMEAATDYIGTLSQSLIDQKKLIPKDPWRQIDGETKYMSGDSDFVKFGGQIQEVTQNGIRVVGQYGHSLQVEYFVLNFPYHLNAGDNIDTANNYAAFENGDFRFITEDGEAKTIPKLNYGKLCARPENADAVELAAQQLNASDNEQITNAIKNAASKQASLDAARQDLGIADKSLQDYLKVTIEAASTKNKATQDKVLKFNQEQADKGNVYGLLRMGERYRDGDGVQKDLNKAREYLTKSAAAGSPTAADELSKLNSNAGTTKQ
jgi:hypothetical protein